MIDQRQEKNDVSCAVDVICSPGRRRARAKLGGVRLPQLVTTT